MRIIFETVFGSRLYGTETEKSDWDFKGVYVPSKQEILLPKIPDVKNMSTGNDKQKNTADDIDREYFAVHKFFDMLIKGDMNAYEMLFAPNSQISNDWNEFIIKNRNKFLSRKCKGFVGYCQRQAAKYGVRGDRYNEVSSVISFLKELKRITFNGAKRLDDFPNFRFEFEQFIKRSFTPKQHTSFETVIVNGQEVFHMICCDRKVPHTFTIDKALEVYNNVLNDYGARAKSAAFNEGVDWKAVSHAVRVGEQAIELLSTGEIIFPRSNAKRLLAIKLGQLDYEPIAEELDFLLETIEQLSNTSNLPDVPDVQFMNDLREVFYYHMVKYG